jgi:RNA polymerase sigma factor (sigma-70 family)
MAAVLLSQLLRRLRGVLAARETAALTDADLWESYVREQDEIALETLVRRHGPMVLGVCLRILRHEQDAEDAFQATFLVLIRKAASLRSPRSLANWLHGVARRTALAARSASAKRQAKEASVLPRIAMTDTPYEELWTVLDKELGQLPEKYRTAVVLCDLEGKSRKEVAQQLGWAEGTVASRLARGRTMLAKRLARLGFAGPVVAAGLASGSAPACMPSILVVSTLAAARFPAAEAAAKGMLSCTVAALTEGVLKSMLLTKLKNAIAVLLLSGIAALSVGALLSWSWAMEPAQAPADGQEREQEHRDDLHDRVVELKQQVLQMQRTIARFEQETQPTRNERKPDVGFLVDRFKYRIPFEIGRTQTNEGGRIKIREVRGTRPRIEVGGQYLVRGRYVLPPGVRGKIHFYATAGGAWGAIKTTLDLQSTTVDKQEGEFALVHGMSGPGNFHLILTAADRYSRWFADVYFGTGDNVWRETP